MIFDFYSFLLISSFHGLLHWWVNVASQGTLHAVVDVAGAQVGLAHQPGNSGKSGLRAP